MAVMAAAARMITTGCRLSLQAASSWPCSNQCFGQLSYRLPGPAT